LTSIKLQILTVSSTALVYGDASFVGLPSHVHVQSSDLTVIR